MVRGSVGRVSSVSFNKGIPDFMGTSGEFVTQDPLTCKKKNKQRRAHLERLAPAGCPGSLRFGTSSKACGILSCAAAASRCPSSVAPTVVFPTASLSCALACGRDWVVRTLTQILHARSALEACRTPETSTQPRRRLSLGIHVRELRLLLLQRRLTPTQCLPRARVVRILKLCVHDRIRRLLTGPLNPLLDKGNGSLRRRRNKMRSDSGSKRNSFLEGMSVSAADAMKPPVIAQGAASVSVSWGRRVRRR